MGTRAVIFDLDGTLANCQHRLHHVSGHKKDWDAFFEGIPDDPPVDGVVSVLRAMARDNNIVLTTGRPEKYREMTEEWLNKHVVPYDVLYMRADGDFRSDHVTKAQIYEGIKQDGYDVYLAIDDRKSIVDLWRSLGICTLQCAPHDDLAPATGILTLLIGPSGSGKSTWCRDHGPHPDEIVSSDRIRHQLCGDFKDQSKNDLVFSAIHALVKIRITHGLNCTVDSTSLRRADRLGIVALARGGPVHYIVINRPMNEKVRDGGWRNDVVLKNGVKLMDAHEQTFQSQLKDILAGDSLPNVQVFDSEVSKMIHPARTMDFDAIEAMVREAVVDGAVNITQDDFLALYTYSRQTTYDRNWTPAAQMCRGLILDHENKKVVATPWPKFWNYGERGDQTIPDLPFEVFEKVDGSMIAIWYHNGTWRASTKGSFRSDQAKWSQNILDNTDTYFLIPGITYICEAIGPQNRIVIHYDEPGLVILGAYDAQGLELHHSLLTQIGDHIGWPVVKRYDYKHISELLVQVPTLPANEEGFVIRFSNGLRLKIKGSEYLRLHRCISNCTPLFIWDAMRAGNDMNDLRRELPEEFWADFDQITDLLYKQAFDIFYKTKDLADSLADLSDKEVGLRLKTLPEDIRRFVFPYRKSNGKLIQGRSREILFREIRPTNNILDGYSASGAMHRIQEEAS